MERASRHPSGSWRDSDVHLDSNDDVTRLFRKQDTVWGLSLDGDDAVIKGIDHTLTSGQQTDLLRMLYKDSSRSVDRLDKSEVATQPARQETRRRWRIGEDFSGHVEPEVALPKPRSVRPFTTGRTFEGILFALFMALLSRARRQGDRDDSQIKRRDVWS